MYASLIPGILVLGMLISFSPEVTHAQVVNADYTEMVKRYSPRPALASLVGGGGSALRIVEVEAPDTLRVGEPGSFFVRANIENAALPFASRWYFGDGDTRRGLASQHTYQRPGRYEVRVVLENHRGRISHDHEVVVIPSDAADAATP